MTLMQSHSTAPAAPLDKHYPMQKVSELGDVPQPLRDHIDTIRWERSSATDLTFEGADRDAYTLTGVAQVDRNRYVVRVRTRSGRTIFYPVTGRDYDGGTNVHSGEAYPGGWAGTHHCCGDTDRTKVGAFQYLADHHQPTIATTADDIAEAAADAVPPGYAQLLDDTDREALASMIAAHDAQLGPRVGDFIRYPDGRWSRFTHDHDESGLQVGMHPHETGEGHNGRFHLSHYGANYSGSLDRCVKREHLTETGERRLGSVWFWHHGRPAAHNGVDALIPFRVFACAVPAAGVGA